MKKLILAAVFSAILLLTGCAGQASKDVDAALSSQNSGSTNSISELTYYPTYDSKYKTATNEVYDFWFDIPSTWKAEGDQNNGKEFSILPDTGNAELKVYGADKDGSEDDFYKKLAGENGTIKEATFEDGWVGKRIQNGSKIYFVRLDGDTFICFYLDYKDDSDWYKNNLDKLDHVAKSLRTRQGSFGNIGSGNKITMDDLKLGKLSLNVTEKEVMNVMKSDPTDEQDSDDDGIKAKTLFFSDETEVYLVDGIVNSIDVISSDYETPRGLKVGDSEARVKELYGEPDVIHDSTHWGYNYDGYELFSIVFKDGKVSELEVDLVM